MAEAATGPLGHEQNSKPGMRGEIDTPMPDGQTEALKMTLYVVPRAPTPFR